VRPPLGLYSFVPKESEPKRDAPASPAVGHQRQLVCKQSNVSLSFFSFFGAANLSSAHRTEKRKARSNRLIVRKNFSLKAPVARLQLIESQFG
jgi:hypothetical protein